MKSFLFATFLLLFVQASVADPVAKNVGKIPLLFTEQIFPVDESGAIVSPGDVSAQVAHLITKVGELLEKYGSGWEKAARIHLCVTSSEVEKEARMVTDVVFRDTPMTWVVSKLPKEGAVIAIDVVAATEFGEKGGPGVKVLPAGARIFISGQASRLKGMEPATRGTMEQLQGTLEQFGRALSDAAQIKSFLGPMDDIEAARAAIESFFPEGETPPLVFVEWESSLPIEIELVAAGGRAVPGNKPMDFITPEGMTASPVFCRVVRVNYGDLVFISGLNGDDIYKPNEQVDVIFQDLEKLVGKHKSDLRHLVKATYYVSENDVSTGLNKLRPDYYDPARPPAASKAMVAGCGDGSTITIDMIAVAGE
jgi:enamine deaminase RidA (YjgF/YER057c/UK114 family)